MVRYVALIVGHNAVFIVCNNDEVDNEIGLNECIAVDGDLGDNNITCFTLEVEGKDLVDLVRLVVLIDQGFVINCEFILLSISGYSIALKVVIRFEP